MKGRLKHRYSHFPVIGCACHACNYCRDKIGMADAPAEGTPELLKGFDTMTTTPDSRIRADWTLPDETAAPVPKTASEVILQRGYEYDPSIPLTNEKLKAYEDRVRSLQPINTSTTATPDTSTTAGKIAVMQQAHDDGWNVQYKFKRKEMDWEFVGGRPLWDWDSTDYRIAPPAPTRSALQAARECREGMTTVDVTSPAGRLCALLGAIDAAPDVNVTQSEIHGMILDWPAHRMRHITPGRYRLVRDDE